MAKNNLFIMKFILKIIFCRKLLNVLLQNLINHSVLPKGRSFTANSAFSTLPSSQTFFSYLHTVHLSWCCLSTNIFFCHEHSTHLPFLPEHPSAGSSFSASSPANFFSSSVSVPALLFLLPFFAAQLHFFILSVHITCSILLHIHISNASSHFCSFCCRVQVSALYNTTLHTKHFANLFLGSFYKDPQEMLLFLLKASFAAAILSFTSWQQIMLLLILHPKYLKLSTCSMDSPLIRISIVFGFRFT